MVPSGEKATPHGSVPTVMVAVTSYGAAHAGVVGAIAVTPTNTLNTRATRTRRITTRLGSNDTTVGLSNGAHYEMFRANVTNPFAPSLTFSTVRNEGWI